VAGLWLAITPKTFATEPSVERYLEVTYGMQFGVMSNRETANDVAFHFLKQGGTVWDALTAVLFHLVLEAPHIVSFDSDVSIMSVSRGEAPRTYWLANFAEPKPAKPEFYAYSRWMHKVLDLRSQKGKLGLDHLLAVPLVRAKQGWQVSAKSREEIASLSEVQDLRTWSSSQVQKSPELAKIFEQIIKQLAWFQVSGSGSLQFLANRQKAVASHPHVRQLAQIPTLVLPPLTYSVFQAKLLLSSAYVVGAEDEWLSWFRTRLNSLARFNAPQLLTQHIQYLRLLSPQPLTNPYRHVFAAVLFDKYGELLSVKVGIPEVSQARRNPETHTLSHFSFDHLKERFWQLASFALWDEKAGLLAALNPLSQEPSSVLDTLPMILTRLKQKKETVAEVLDMPQFAKLNPQKLLTNQASKPYRSDFREVQSVDSLIEYLGLEVMPTQVQGFVSKSVKVKPLLY
jgi:hypothetical protein